MKTKKEIFHKKISIALLLLFISFNIVNIHAYEHLLEGDSNVLEDCTDCKILLEKQASNAFVLFESDLNNNLKEPVFVKTESEKYISIVPKTIEKGFLFCRPPPGSEL